MKNGDNLLPAGMNLGKKATVKDGTKGDVNDDWNLVRGCQQGERQAQQALYQKYKDSVFSIALRMTNNRQEAEDIAQMAFMRIFNKIDSFRGDSALSSWIYRLTVNVCINHFRKDKKRKALMSQEFSELQSGNVRTLKSENVAESSSLRPFLEKAIRALPAGYRMIFVLYDIEGYTHQEIAEMMNISEGTSKSQLHKARKELKQILEPCLAMYRSL